MNFWVVFILCLLIFVACMFVFGFWMFFIDETEFKIKKIKFKQFLKFYCINPDGWDSCESLCSSSSKNCVKYFNCNEGYTFKFRFGFVDYFRFLLFKERKKKKQEEEEETNKELRFIRCIQNDINKYQENIDYLEGKIRRL